ncbi:MAG: glutamate--tRNA ligase [Nitrospirota bacterium]
MEKVRVRFAPSPTGYLHIGGVRTALFNWLFARHNKGTFVLRIEDTDRSRSTEESIQAIIDGMRWLGLDWDEGPFRQTDRLSLYRKHVEKLLAEDKAYYCYCTPEELEQRRKKAIAEGRPPKYNGRCRELKSYPAGRTSAIRFKSLQKGTTIVDDIIKGRVEFDNHQLDDLIILRADGFPTYNFAVVVDDVTMGITHVIRGDDHLNNTPRQIQLYNAFGYPEPMFAHLPMILGSDRTRLSKRHGATSVISYKEMGYLPEAMVNYLVRLGWSHGDQEVFSVKELIEKFSLEAVGKSAAIFNHEKLLWLNSYYINHSPAERLLEAVMPFLIKGSIIEKETMVEKEWLCRVINSLKERCKTLVELADSMVYFIVDYVAIDEKVADKFLSKKSIPLLKKITERLRETEPFTQSEIEQTFKELSQQEDVKLGDIAQPVRVAVTGRTVSPGIYEVLELVGKEKTIRRLEKAIGKTPQKFSIFGDPWR